MATTHNPNPTLVEAYVEFWFDPPDGTEWDSFVVPRFFKKVAAKFPIRKRVESVRVDAGMATSIDPSQIAPNGSPTPSYHFFSQDKRSLVQLGENLLVVNYSTPYPGWKAVQTNVIECFELYVKLWKPETVVRAGLHYIDRLDLPEDEDGLEKYLNVLPNLPNFPDKPATNVSMCYEVAGAEEGDVMAVSLRQQPSDSPDGLTFLFQRDYEAQDAFAPDRNTLWKWLDRAYNYVDRTFQEAVTDDCRNLFK